MRNGDSGRTAGPEDLTRSQDEAGPPSNRGLEQQERDAGPLGQTQGQPVVRSVVEVQRVLLEAYRLVAESASTDRFGDAELLLREGVTGSALGRSAPPGHHALEPTSLWSPWEAGQPNRAGPEALGLVVGRGGEGYQNRGDANGDGARGGGVGFFLCCVWLTCVEGCGRGGQKGW